MLDDLDLGQSMKEIFKGARATTTDVSNELVLPSPQLSDEQIMDEN